MGRPAPIPSDPVRSCSAPCRLPSPPRQCRHNLPQTPPPPRPDDGRVRRETVLLWKTALEWVQHRSPPQHMVWYLGCKPIFYSLKSRFDNFRTGPKTNNPDEMASRLAPMSLPELPRAQLVDELSTQPSPKFRQLEPNSLALGGYQF